MVKFYAAALILLSAVVLRGYLFVNESRIKLPRNQEITFEFMVKAEPKAGEKSQVIKAADGQLFAPIFPKYHYGDKLRVSGRVDENGDIFKPEITQIGRSNSLYARIQTIRGLISGKLSSLLPRKEAALLVGSVLGVDDLGKEFKDKLIKTGTIHVVVVSGQNLAIVAGVFVAFSSYIGRRKAMFLASAAVVFYAALTGFAPPVLRACIMVIVASLGVLFGREVHAIWSLLISALLILFLWPAAIAEISFQLTFAASLGIMTLGRELQEVAKVSKVAKVSNVSKVIEAIMGSGAVALSAYAFTAPIIFFYFGRVSIVAPVANILVVEAVAPIMAIGFISALSTLFFLPLAHLFAYFAYVPAFYFVKVVEFCAGLPLAQVEFGKGSWGLVAGWYAMVLFLTIVLWRKTQRLSS